MFLSCNTRDRARTVLPLWLFAAIRPRQRDWGSEWNGSSRTSLAAACLLSAGGALGERI